MADGWFIAWITGKGNSVGPGIIKMGRDCARPQCSVPSMAWTPDYAAAAPSGAGAGFGEDAFPLADEVEVAEVDEEARALADHEHGVHPVGGVDEEGEPAADREEPEGDRDHALLLSLGGDPLHEE